MKESSAKKSALSAEISASKKKIAKLGKSEAKHKRVESRGQTVLAALRESEARFRTLVENAALGIYRTTPDGRVLLANPALSVTPRSPNSQPGILRKTASSLPTLVRSSWP
ncbi:MAG: PAS domain-containing protein [Acidobacteria bacterium]|nr:PAS domain-containing protein [Acidobacteriota bacterium]